MSPNCLCRTFLKMLGAKISVGPMISIYKKRRRDFMDHVYWQSHVFWHILPAGPVEVLRSLWICYLLKEMLWVWHPDKKFIRTSLITSRKPESFTENCFCEFYSHIGHFLESHWSYIMDFDDLPILGLSAPSAKLLVSSWKFQNPEKSCVICSDFKDFV